MPPLATAPTLVSVQPILRLRAGGARAGIVRLGGAAVAKRVPGRPPVLPGHTYVRPLGSGGFADVFLFEQDMPRRAIAVKVLDGDSWDPETRRLFEAEADTMARLSSHPSILSIYDASISADGRPFLTMEYCPDSMRARSRAQLLTLSEILDVGVRMASALETVHLAGVLHRDVKPSNVLVTSLGRPVLADFGISGSLTPEGESEQIALSVPWSAPELVLGQDSGSVASEVWSLGATLFTFAAGYSPFEVAEPGQNTREKMTARIRKARYPGLPNAVVFGTLDAVLGRALEKAPERRYASMREFAEALRQLQRTFGFDVTPLDLLTDAALQPQPQPAPPAAAGSRGPVIATVRADSRRAARAQAAAESRARKVQGTRARRQLTSAQAALLGAGGTVLLGALAWGVSTLIAGGG